MRWEYRNTVLVLCTLAFFATMVARLVISPVVPAIVSEFGTSSGTIGLAFSGMWAAYALSQFPSGLLADRYGERRVILTAVSTTAVASAALALSPSMATFGLFAVLLGAGAGLHYVVATTLLTRLFSNTGRAIGLHVTGSPLAGLSAPVLAAAIGSRYGWRVALLLGTVAAVPVGLVFAWRVRETEPQHPERPLREGFEPRTLLELLSRPAIAYTTVLAVISAFTWQATASFLPTFLIARHGYSTALAGMLFSLYFVAHGVFAPAIGSFSDRFGRDPTLGATLAVGILAYPVLVLGPSLPVVVLGVVLAGIAMSWSAPLQDRYIVRLSEGEENRGFGLVRTVYMLLGALGSVATGTLADLAGWGVAYGALGVLLAVAVGSLVIVRLRGLAL
ncbi:multidrug resistance protein MdtL [Halalkalicoccus paucihalophilus]|uniref:Multidrug resistance protein MdtL n=1 Tax=Halalkalicoccus paucihalophilus TaxID=1008153 RepID=A0A151AII7_9EURY|nr:MFS transporter [Halalkalicoccus paucihalophilus]KYH27395.1 multidrug resistance protein MdtL [Halalkalicoccus paucihalophilus]